MPRIDETRHRLLAWSSDLAAGRGETVARVGERGIGGRSETERTRSVCREPYGRVRTDSQHGPPAEPAHYHVHRPANRSPWRVPCGPKLVPSCAGADINDNMDSVRLPM